MCLSVRASSSKNETFCPRPGVLSLTVYLFPLIASAIRTPFDKCIPDLIEIWALVCMNRPWHMSITMTSSPSLAATPHAQKLGFADLLHFQKRIWTWKLKNEGDVTNWIYSHGSIKYDSIQCYVITVISFTGTYEPTIDLLPTSVAS